MHNSSLFGDLLGLAYIRPRQGNEGSQVMGKESSRIQAGSTVHSGQVAGHPEKCQASGCGDPERRRFRQWCDRKQGRAGIDGRPYFGKTRPQRQNSAPGWAEGRCRYHGRFRNIGFRNVQDQAGWGVAVCSDGCKREITSRGLVLCPRTPGRVYGKTRHGHQNRARH
mgnify:CR=1 FL=1